MNTGAQNALKAYEVVLNPMTHQEQRNKATGFLENLKSDPAACRTVGLDLARNPNPQARVLAFILLESITKLHWKKLSPQQKIQVRKDVLDILASPPQAGDTGFVREKIASLVNEVAKRDWPNEWPEYFDALVRISNVGDPQREMVLLVIRRLIEDVTTFSRDLTKNRCDQLMGELKAKSKQLMAFLTQGLQAQQKAWNANHSEAAGKVAVRIIETLSTFFSWVAPSIIFDAKVPALLCSFLGDVHKLRMAAAEAILHLVEQEHGKISIAHKFLFPMEHVPVFTRALESNQGTASEKNAFHQTLGKVLVAVGKKHLTLAEKHNFPVPPSYPEFLTVVGKFLEHNDLVFCETTIPFFAQLLRAEVFKKSAAFDKIAPSIASAFVKKLINGITPESRDLLLSMHFSDDGDDFNTANNALTDGKARLENFLTKFVAILKDVLRKVANARPELVLGIAMQEIKIALGNVQKGNQKITSKKSREYLCMQGCIDCVDGFMRNGILFDDIIQSNNQVLKERLSSGVKQVLLLFFNFETGNPLLLGLKIKSLRCFSAYYKHNGKVLTLVLERILKVVLFRGPNEAKTPHVQLSKMTLRVRKEACDSFMRICVELPSLLVNQIGPIAEHVTGFLIKGDTSFAEKAILREGLIAVSTALDKQQQVAFVKQVVGPIMNVWTAKTMEEVVGDCEKFLQWVGAAPDCSPKWENGRALISVLETFRTTIKRSPRAAKEMLPALLPNVFLVCRTIHRLWKPGHAAHNFLRSKLPKVFAPDSRLYESLLGRKTEQNFELFVATWLQQSRESAYKVIGVSCKVPEFYNIPNLPKVLNSFVFAEISHVAIQHITILVEHVIENLLMHTPPPAFVPFLQPLLPGLFAFLLDRLFLCWKKESDIRRGEGNKNTDEEVIETKLSMDFARSWFRVLLHALHVERNQSMIQDGNPEPSLLCKFMTGTEDVVMGVLATIIGALCNTCDSITLSHTMEILERMIGFFLKNPKLHNILGGQVLHGLFIAVSKRANHENTSRFLRVAAEIYIRLSDVCPQTRGVLRDTGVSHSLMQQMENRLRAVDGTSKKTPKNRAKAMTETLGDWVGKDCIGLAAGPSPIAIAFLKKFGNAS